MKSLGTAFNGNFRPTWIPDVTEGFATQIRYLVLTRVENSTFRNKIVAKWYAVWKMQNCADLQHARTAQNPPTSFPCLGTNFNFPENLADLRTALMDQFLLRDFPGKFTSLDTEREARENLILLRTQSKAQQSRA